MLKSILKSSNSITRRCAADELTRARLKYDPCYHAIERQEGTKVWVGGREMIMMSSNDYLGLTNHPKIVEASKQALEQWGSSTTGAAFANGRRSLHRELEEALAAFLGKEDCQITCAGYLACMASVATFARRDDLVLVDRNVHSSLWSGIQMAGSRLERIAHNSPAHLQELLCDEPADLTKLVVLEGVYSMEGHIAPLAEMVKVAEGHDVFFIVDDAHGLGVIGPEGRGSLAHAGVTEAIDLVCGSFSKSFASTGGYVAGSREVLEYFRTYSKQAIFSAALSPAQTAAALAAIKVMQEEPQHRQRLLDNTRYYKQLLEERGLNTWGSETAAIPIVIGDKMRAYRTWKRLFEMGIFTIAAFPPGVPPGKDLIRTAVSARHSREDLERVAEAIERAIR